MTVEDWFIKECVSTALPVTVFLVNGVKLGGVITRSDEKCISLRKDEITQIVYKNAIASIMPSKALSNI